MSRTGLLATVAVAANDHRDSIDPRAAGRAGRDRRLGERAAAAPVSPRHHSALSAPPGIIAIPARCRAGSHRRVGEGAGALRSLPRRLCGRWGMSWRTHRLIPHRRRVSTGQGTATAGVCVAALVSVLTGCGSGGAGDGTANQPGASVESPTATGPASTASDAQRAADGVGTTVSDRRADRPSRRRRRFRSQTMSTAVWSRTMLCGRS